MQTETNEKHVYSGAGQNENIGGKKIKKKCKTQGEEEITAFEQLYNSSSKKTIDDGAETKRRKEKVSDFK